MIRKIWVYLLLWSAHLSLHAATTYYVDSQNGNDGNSGINESLAWQTTNKVSSLIFQPGDQILFKRGCIFQGDLLLNGNGTQYQPITVASYGNGNRPVISAEGKSYAVRLFNAENWIIGDLETRFSTEAGIFIGCSSGDRILGNIKISNCYIHDIGDTTKVSWDLSTHTGGIIVVNGNLNENGEPVFYNSVYDNVIIEDCTVMYNYRWTCISITSGKISNRSGNANKIRNCTVAYSSADGIRMNGVTNSLIEYCVLYKNGAWPNPEGHNLGGLGAWFFDAENCTIQYCEAGWVRTAVSDGGAFDIDYRQKNSTVQYCYGHHCASYGVSVFGAEASNPTLNSTIRYNIFSSNAMDKKFGVQGEYFVFTWSGGLLNGVNIHDNISYWDPVVPAPAHNFNADFTGNNSNIFKNNTVITRKPWVAFHKNDSMKSDTNTFIALSTPVYWKMKNDSCDNLIAWQSLTGMEKGSTFENGSAEDGVNKWTRIAIPDWYKPNLNAIKISGKIRKVPPMSGRVNHPGISLNDSVSIIFFTAESGTQKDEFFPARVQLNYLKSMIRQYRHLGLKVFVIDESYTLSGKLRNGGSENFQIDHSQVDLTWIKDDAKMNLAGHFGVSGLPATYLVSSDAEVIRKWEGVVLPAELAFAIEDTFRY